MVALPMVPPLWCLSPRGQRMMPSTVPGHLFAGSIDCRDHDHETAAPASTSNSTSTSLFMNSWLHSHNLRCRRSWLSRLPHIMYYMHDNGV